MGQRWRHWEQMIRTRSQFGPYTLLYPLGVGGMGEVFLARQQGEHGIVRLVALKRILVHLARQEHLTQLFLDEVRIAAQLTHGNVVQVIDHGVIDGQYFMAMEYVHGEDLMEVLAKLKGQGLRLPLDLTLYIGACVCEGLDYAHQKRDLEGQPLELVHRDISPHNVLLSFQGGVKIADFGVARATAQTHQTQGGELRGKLAYMSPEQAYGRALDQRSDLFSLGVVLYEMLAGESPFLRSDQMATLEAVRAADFAPLEGLSLELPDELTQLVCRLLHRDPDQRPDSARTLHDELQQIMRLYHLGPSAFDLADYLQDLFPEVRQSEGAAGTTDPVKTVVGRRAAPTPGDAERGADERSTIHYLELRHGKQQSSAATRNERPRPASRRRWPWALGGASLLMLAGVGALLMSSGQTQLFTTRAENAPPRQPAGLAAPAAGQSPAPRPAADGSQQDPRPAAAPPPTAAPAILQLRSQPPGARVLIAGKPAGSTPLQLELPPGQAPLRLLKEGYAPWEQTPRLTAGQLTSLLAKLTPLPARLSIRSTHPCQAKVRGRAVGQTPVELDALPAGEATVSCQNLGLELQAQKRLRLLPGKSSTVDFAFGVLAINVEPWAQVQVDGQPRGTTPLRLLLPAGEHRVQLSNPDKPDLRRSQTVRVPPAQTARISSW